MKVMTPLEQHEPTKHFIQAIYYYLVGDNGMARHNLEIAEICVRLCDIPKQPQRVRKYHG